MGDGPGGAGDGDRENHEEGELVGEVHCQDWMRWWGLGWERMFGDVDGLEKQTGAGDSGGGTGRG